MNPSQAPGGQPTGQPPVPQDQNPAYIPDVPDAAFEFADTPPQTTAYRPIAPPPARPVVTPAPRPTPATVAPAPTPQLPPQPAMQASPMPADVLPPQSIPTIPTLATPAPAPAPIAEPVATLQPLTAAPVQAAPANSAVSATFSPQSTAHVPDDIAARLAETPMQNSSDINKMVTGKGTSRLKGFLSFAIFTAAIFAAAFLINQFIFQSYYVEGTSMTPTLQNNDRLIISKVERTLSAIQGRPYIPERGQIVVLDSSIVGVNGQKEQLIKRVIGLPGDKVHIENGTVTITDTQYPTGIDITKALGLTNLKDTYSDAVIDLTVPQNQVYVMGDNREQGGSYDSRSFGPIDGDKIQGRLWARILPFDKAQVF